VTLAAALANQNCGSTGTAGFGSVGAGQVNSVLATKPIPVQHSFNQLSYMSCPQSSTGNSNGDPLGAPFYRIRVGAYDNSAANGFVDPTNTGKTVDNVGGLGFTQSAMNYMRSVDPTPTPPMLANFLTTSPYTANSQPVVALINEYRTQYSLSWTALASQLLTPLNNSVLVSAVTNETQLPGGPTAALGYFPTLPVGTNTIVGTLNWGASIADEQNFRTNLINEYIFAGFAPTANTDATSITQNLQGPDGSPTGRLFGYGYSFVFAPNSPIVSQIEEWDLNPTTPGNPTNLTVANNEQWDCFSLAVVRDIDRKYWTVSNAYTSTPFSFQSPYLTQLLGGSGMNPSLPMYAGAVLHPMDVNAIGEGNPALQANYFRSGVVSANGVNAPVTTNSIPYVMYSLERNYSNDAAVYVAEWNAAQGTPPTQIMASPVYNAGLTFGNNVASIPTVNLYMGANGYDGGTYYACPPEDPLLTYVPVAGDTPAILAQKAINTERLRVIRRFLPANLWEVNITSMCAVPTAAAETMGSCYASGDTDMSKYIQYGNAVPGTNCGNGMTECGASASFCWRYH